MSDLPELSYLRILPALQRLGFVHILQIRGSLVLRRKLPDNSLQTIILPARRVVTSVCLSNILKKAGITEQTFLDAL